VPVEPGGEELLPGVVALGPRFPVGDVLDGLTVHAVDLGVGDGASDAAAVDDDGVRVAGSVLAGGPVGAWVDGGDAVSALADGDAAGGFPAGV
jgi:hypothetical protein